MKHHNQLRSGSLLTYVQMTLNIIVSIAYTPFMLRILGKSEYGLYSTVASTIAILSVLSLGFGGSYVRYYILYRKEKADDKIARLNGLFLIVFSVIGLIALACGLYLTFHLEMVFKTGLTDAEYHTARILMLLLTANLAVSFPMSAQEQFVFLKATEILRTVVSPLVTLPVLLINDGHVMDSNLTSCGYDRTWLDKRLKERRLTSPRQVFLMTVDEAGTVVCVAKEETA